MRAGSRRRRDAANHRGAKGLLEGVGLKGQCEGSRSFRLGDSFLTQLAYQWKEHQTQQSTFAGIVSTFGPLLLWAPSHNLEVPPFFLPHFFPALDSFCTTPMVPNHILLPSRTSPAPIYIYIYTCIFAHSIFSNRLFSCPTTNHPIMLSTISPPRFPTHFLHTPSLSLSHLMSNPHFPTHFQPQFPSPRAFPSPPRAFPNLFQRQVPPLLVPSHLSDKADIQIKRLRC